ncbi:major facilitator superfamily transporter [Tritrichomonas foetus]|uniref:Major facilitator superfamily transporter n=1 Tax=Tritrichomonas foetus TaxID=1144522 RepID=A0A1J4KR79_9EUKA|nr:major facilitator superfamily transporter [Tritrichomonas foetus]|eukprot:OHT13767.1 major facilitator superfamily transporter [Tritrichomonas foetus]
MGFCRKELAYVFVLVCGSTFVGQSLGYWSPAGPPMMAEFGWSTTIGSLFSSLSSIVAIIGGPLTNLIVPKLGRKLPCFIYAVIATITWIVICVTKKSFFWLAFLMRAIQGICVGGLSSLCSMYIVEISPMENKQAYGTFHQFGVTIGIAYCYFLGIFCEWRLLTGLCCIFSGLLAILIWFIPESPVVTNLKLAQASGQSAIAEKDRLFQRKYFKPLIASFFFMFFQQFSGINATGTNMQSIFINAKIDLDPSLCAFLVGISQCISTGFTSIVVKKFGKKIAMNISALGQAVSLLLVWVQDVFHVNSILSLVALFLDFFFFGVGFGPVPWFIVPELFPDSVRQLATSIFTGLNWAFVTIIIFMWPPMESGIGLGWGLFVYAVVCVIGFVWGLLWMPDASQEEQPDTTPAIHHLNDNGKLSEDTSNEQTPIQKDDVNIDHIEITADDPEPVEL